MQHLTSRRAIERPDAESSFTVMTGVCARRAWRCYMVRRSDRISLIQVTPWRAVILNRCTNITGQGAGLRPF